MFTLHPSPRSVFRVRGCPVRQACRPSRRRPTARSTGVFARALQRDGWGDADQYLVFAEGSSLPLSPSAPSMLSISTAHPRVVAARRATIPSHTLHHLQPWNTNSSPLRHLTPTGATGHPPTLRRHPSAAHITRLRSSQATRDRQRLPTPRLPSSHLRHTLFPTKLASPVTVFPRRRPNSITNQTHLRRQRPKTRQFRKAIATDRCWFHQSDTSFRQRHRQPLPRSHALPCPPPSFPLHASE